ERWRRAAPGTPGTVPCRCPANPASGTSPWRSFRRNLSATGRIVAARRSACRGVDAVAQSGEKVVLREVGIDQGAGEDVVLGPVDLVGHFGRQPEPERRRRVDLGLVRQQGGAARIRVVGDIDERGDAVVLAGTVDPLLIERRLEPELLEALVQG